MEPSQQVGRNESNKALPPFSEDLALCSRLEEMGCDQNSIPMEVINERHKEILTAFEHVVGDLTAEAPHLLDRCLRRLIVLRYPRIKWARLEGRLEGWVKEHPDWSPSRLATTAQYYLKVDRKMLPLLRQTARRIKRRVYMRTVRKELACLDERTP